MMRVRIIALGAALAGVAAGPARALPTMIRLGYTNCAACHISPQGAGLLNAYGRGIDEAQSLRAGEYQPSENGFAKSLSWGGRITQDLRTVIQEQGTSVGSQPYTNFFRPCFMYRNATELGRGFRLSATVTGETESAARPTLAYDPIQRPPDVFVNTALLHYRAAKSLEFAVGRDQLPSGINIPDLAVFIKSRNGGMPPMGTGAWPEPTRAWASASGAFLRNTISPTAPASCPPSPPSARTPRTARSSTPCASGWWPQR